MVGRPRYRPGGRKARSTRRWRDTPPGWGRCASRWTPRWSGTWRRRRVPRRKCGVSAVRLLRWNGPGDLVAVVDGEDLAPHRSTAPTYRPGLESNGRRARDDRRRQLERGRLVGRHEPDSARPRLADDV